MSSVMRPRLSGDLCRILVVAISAPWLFATPAARAEEPGMTMAERSPWQVEKCTVFSAALDRILKRMGEDGVSPAFLANNRAYIDSGCLAPVDACPETPKDIEIANGLTIATMNAGAASSFSPFRCRPKG